MKLVKYKWFWAWNYEKEEEWLNQMSSKGYQLIDYALCRYVFEEGKNNEYTYRIELLEDMPNSEKGRKYLDFLKEAEVEHISSYTRWVYLRKKKELGDFDLYSDIESRINHYKRMNTLFLAIFPLMIINLINSSISLFTYSDIRPIIILDILIILLFGLIGYGIIKTTRKISKLKKEKIIRE